MPAADHTREWVLWAGGDGDGPGGADGARSGGDDSGAAAADARGEPGAGEQQLYDDGAGGGGLIRQPATGGTAAGDLRRNGFRAMHRRHLWIAGLPGDTADARAGH